MATGATEMIEASAAQQAGVQRVFVALNGTPRIAYLVAPNGEKLPLPESLFRVLLQAAMVLARGEEVLVSPVDRMMTTQQAADMLNVSRPYLVRLLSENKIPYQNVGRHRRVKFGDVIKYKLQRASERRLQLEALVRESEEAGLYDLPPILGRGKLDASERAKS